MPELEQVHLLALAVALGIGLLIGTERERSKGSGKARHAAGIRTFSIAALLGAISMLMGGVTLLAIALLLTGALAVVAYLRTRTQDPGLTTEIALLLTCLLGGMATQDMLLASGTGVALTVLLAGRQRIHQFVRTVLSERELHDIILFAAAALIVLPLAPDRYMGPFDAINPHAVARLIVLVMGVSALGYVATRLLGPRYGLPLAGFAGGFISSTAVIFSMGLLTKRQPDQTTPAVAGAVLSSIATIIQLALIIMLIQPSLLTLLTQPLALGGAAAIFYALIFLFITRKAPVLIEEHHADMGRAIELKTALGFALVISAVLTLSAALHSWLGSNGIMLGALVSGLADAHATAASAASLAATQKITDSAAVWPILTGLTTNSLMKAIVAFKAGGTSYAMRILPGLALVIAVIWLSAGFR
jgi:uncharacterized membrane protein (DUF4010 family)